MTQENTTHLQTGRGTGLVQEGGGGGICYAFYPIVVVLKYLSACSCYQRVKGVLTATTTKISKRNVLIRKTTTLHVHTFLVHFFAVTARLQCEIALISCSVENINEG